jgi:hypothetical protein
MEQPPVMEELENGGAAATHPLIISLSLSRDFW